MLDASNKTLIHLLSANYDDIRLQSSPVFVATLSVGDDSVGVAFEYQAFIVEKTLANKILTRDSYGVRRTFISFGYKPAAPTELIPRKQ